MEKTYRLLYPMRAVLVSSSAEGKDNIMTACWCFPVSADPPLFAVSMGKKGLSQELVQKGREYVINIPGPDMVRAVETCGSEKGRTTDKWEAAKLTKEESEKVAAPSIAECQASIECELEQAVDAGDHFLLIGKAVNVRRRKGGKGVYQSEAGLVEL
ncbi:TPA: flavin reductase family protein [Candidatus Micrarchaeota archaeon]|nr:flavin reductase family protein [Candidatus Micrarchaeota archaeon]